MLEPIRFHTDLYRREALESAAAAFRVKAEVELTELESHIAVHVKPNLAEDTAKLLDEFCNDVFTLTARKLRDLRGNAARNHERPSPSSNTPPWALLAPFSEGMPLALGWVLDSLSPVRSGAATLVLRHETHGNARVAIRRNDGAPLGVAHTNQLDFMLMNGGSGTTRTDESIGRVLLAMAQALDSRDRDDADEELLDSLLPHSELQASRRSRPANGTADTTAALRHVTPQLDHDSRTIAVEFDERGISRLSLYDTVLAFADRCFVFLDRHEPSGIRLRLKSKIELDDPGFHALATEVAEAIGRAAGNSPLEPGLPGSGTDSGLPQLPGRRIDIDALIADLEAADPATVGLGFQPDRGPGHEGLRILNILGTGACNSDCLFCCEKFNPSNRLMPSADATRQLITNGKGRFDMLFFASGEPTIHPKLFEYVELAKSMGFTCFGMSSHFRTFADPRFALKILQSGFEYFDISLHAADAETQLDVNPIDDEGASLFEALKGLGNIVLLAQALGIRISITHKTVVSRLNVTRLEEIFHATYDRGVRHFILQPVRTLGLSPERQQALAISEDEILPYVNDLLVKAQDLGAIIKPYGFSRKGLFQGDHIEHEQNRVKNVSGKNKSPRGHITLPSRQEEKPTDGRLWIELTNENNDRFGFAWNRSGPVLDEALGRGAHLPFGCRMGSCGMCCAKIVSGEIEQNGQHFLSDEQVRQGYVLLCQARPISDVTLRMCTDDEIDPL